jgi:hypothetical protein
VQVFPGHGSVHQGRADVNELHRSLVGDHDVFEIGNAAIGEERREPSRMGQDVGQIGQLRQNGIAEERRHAIAMVALAHAGDGRVDGDH